MSDRKYYLQRREEYLKRAKERHIKNRKADNRYRKDWYSKNRDKVREQCKAYYATHKEEARRRAFKLNYGITLEQLLQQKRRQKYRCGICRRKESELRRGLFADHNHKTKQLRGLLCAQCNFGLGHFRDSKILLKRAVAYL